MRRWIGPSLIAVVVVLLYQLLAAPFVADLRADWAFLHMARESAYRQAQQQGQK